MNVKKDILKKLNFKKISKEVGLPKAVLKDFIEVYIYKYKKLPTEFMTFLSVKYQTKNLDTNLIVKEYYKGRLNHLYELIEEMEELREKYKKKEEIKND